MNSSDAGRRVRSSSRTSASSIHRKPDAGTKLAAPTTTLAWISIREMRVGQRRDRLDAGAQRVALDARGERARDRRRREEESSSSPTRPISANGDEREHVGDARRRADAQHLRVEELARRRIDARRRAREQRAPARREAQAPRRAVVAASSSRRDR